MVSKDRVKEALLNLVLVRYEFNESVDKDGQKFRDKVDALAQEIAELK